MISDGSWSICSVLRWRWSIQERARVCLSTIPGQERWKWSMKSRHWNRLNAQINDVNYKITIQRFFKCFPSVHHHNDVGCPLWNSHLVDANEEEVLQRQTKHKANSWSQNVWRGLKHSSQSVVIRQQSRQGSGKILVQKHGKVRHRRQTDSIWELIHRRHKDFLVSNREQGRVLYIQVHGEQVKSLRQSIRCEAKLTLIRT